MKKSSDFNKFSREEFKRNEQAMSKQTQSAKPKNHRMRMEKETVFMPAFARYTEKGSQGVLGIKIDDYHSGLMTSDHEVFFVTNSDNFEGRLVDDGLYQILFNDENTPYSDYTRVSLYDAKKHQMIVDGAKLQDDFSFMADDLVFGVMNEETGKYHILNSLRYREHPEEFSEKYDSVQLISPNEYIVSKNGKFGIYSVDGFQTKLEYDDISLADEYGDFEYGNLVDLKLKKVGQYFYYTNGKMMDASFDDVKPVASFIMMGKHGSMIDLINREDGKIMTSLLADDVSSLTYPYLFTYLKDGQVGVFCLKEKLNYDNGELYYELTHICEPIYDSVQPLADDSDMILLEKDGKFGLLYLTPESIICQMPAEYDEIKPLFSHFMYQLQLLEPAEYDKIKPLFSSYVAFYHQGQCDIYNMNQQRKVLDNIVITDLGENYFIYHDDSGYNLKTPLFSNLFGVEGVEEIKHLGNGFFCVTEDGKKNLYFFCQCLSKDAFEQIEICPECRQIPHYDCDPIYFSVKREDGMHLMKICREYGILSRVLEEVSPGITYSNIRFLDDMIVLDNAYGFHTLMDYHGRKIADTIHDVQCVKNEVGKDKIYVAGNCVFMYNHGLDVFIESGVKIKRPFYTAAYEGDYGTVVVNEFDSNKYKSICQSIEEMSDDEFNGVLKRLYEDSSQVQEQYPKLLIREKK